MLLLPTYNTPAQSTSNSAPLISTYHKPATTTPIAEWHHYQNNNAQQELNNSYLGIGIAPGISNGGGNGENAIFGGNVQGRYKIDKTPLSLRGTFLFDNHTTATIPTLTLDVPVAANTNIFFGGGYSLIGTEGKNTPLGNKDAAVITGGLETGLGKHLVAYSDIDWGIHAFQSSNASAASLQFGVGYGF